MEITRKDNINIMRQLTCSKVYNFYLEQDNKIFEISFQGNLDLYWRLRYKNIEKTSREELNKERIETFTITKENYFIYSLFETLMDDIKNARVYISTSGDSDDPLDKDSEERCKEWNERLKNKYYYDDLYDGERITWYSDEDSLEVTDIVIIEKIDDNFVLEFIQQELTNDVFVYRTPGSICIRFRNSGSRYDEFYIPFMRMYRKIQDYDPKNHQIHIEELEYQKKLKLHK